MKTLKIVIVIMLLSSCLIVDAQAALSPGTGLDKISTIIKQEERLTKKVDAVQIKAAENAAMQMNSLIIEAIMEEGLANDGSITAADAMQVNAFLVKHYQQDYMWLREQYHAIECKGAQHKILNINAVNYVFSNIYNLGLEAYDDCRMSSPDGKKGSSFKTVSYYLGELLADELASQTLVNPDFQEVAGTTGTALDSLIGLIFVDRGLNSRVATGEMREAARSADAMNHLILEAIVQEGLANDGWLSPADAREINHYLVTKYADTWAELHGDDEEDEEFGYHYIQSDGATTRMFADNLFDSVLDGIYHLGFETDKQYCLVNEDGNSNKSFEKVAWWLNTLLEAELQNGTLVNPAYQEIVGTTGTTLDLVILAIYNDKGLQYRVATSDIRAGAFTANAMNELIVEAIRMTGVANDDYISDDEIGELNRYLVARYANEWVILHGDDEEDFETGFHRIQNDGAVSEVFGRNLINNVADSIYHLGFKTPYEKRLVNEDGNKNECFSNISYWLNRILKGDFESGILK